MESSVKQADNHFHLDRCFLCDFSFTQVSVLEDGTCIENERSELKLKLTKDRVKLIRQILCPSTVDDFQHEPAMCLKCYKKIESVTRHEKIATEERARLIAGWKSRQAEKQPVVTSDLTSAIHDQTQIPAITAPEQSDTGNTGPTFRAADDTTGTGHAISSKTASVETEFIFKPIGYLKSPFTFKNGTPRQATVCSKAKGIIFIEKTIFTNPEHSLEGLGKFSHVWIMFIFHKNDGRHHKAKVKPPRLNGERVGVFSTRSPYRPNNIGLSLAKIEKVEGASVTVSGIDILDGTPIVDIKPYIVQYDCPRNFPASLQKTTADMTENLETVTSTAETVLDLNTSSLVDDPDFCLNKGTVKSESSDVSFVSDISKNENNDVSFASDHTSKTDGSCCLVNREENDQSTNTALSPSAQLMSSNSSLGDAENENQSMNAALSSSAEWITTPPVSTLCVRFTPRALDQLSNFTTTSVDRRFRLKFMQSSEEAKQAIVNILHEDPRSVYRRKKCVDSLYYFTVDVIHVTCWFDSDDIDDEGDSGNGDVKKGCVEVVRVKPACDVDQCKHKF